MEKVSVPAEIQPGLKIPARTNGLKKPKKVKVIGMQFQFGLKRELEHCSIKQDGGCKKKGFLSARVKIRHAIAPIFKPPHRAEILHVIIP